MGRLFTYEEIAYGQVPTPEDFLIAKNEFIASAEYEIAEGKLTGAFIYGSVAINLANRRSDFDGVISIHDKNGNYKVAQKIAKDITNSYIPVGLIAQYQGELTSGHHEMDRYFGEHLRSSDRIILGKDPAPEIIFDSSPAQEIMSSYLSQKKRKLIDTFVTASPTDVHEGGLQRMLELPVAVGRKALQAIAETNSGHRAVKKSADKKLVMQSFMPFMEQFGTKKQTKQLIELNRFYNRILVLALNNKINTVEYNEGLGLLHGSIPEAIDWVKAIEKNLLPLLKSTDQTLKNQ